MRALRLQEQFDPHRTSPPHTALPIDDLLLGLLDRQRESSRIVGHAHPRLNADEICVSIETRKIVVSNFVGPFSLFCGTSIPG